MTIGIVITTKEGIVFSADSRITYNATKNANGEDITPYVVAQYDIANKLFLCRSKIGILCVGTGEIDGTLIGQFIEKFISNIADECCEIETLPQKLLDYFIGIDQSLNSQFLVAGYKKVGSNYEPQIWEVNVVAKSCTKLHNIDYPHSFIQWRGETDPLKRLLLDSAFKRLDGKYEFLDTFKIPFEKFTIEDAAEFCQTATVLTANIMSFHRRNQTIGGFIDILAITPEASFWVQKKEN